MDVFLLHYLCGSLTQLSTELFTKMLLQNKRVEKKYHTSTHVFLLLKFHSTIQKFWILAWGVNQQPDSPCSIALLFCQLILTTSHDIFEKVPRDLIIIQLTPWFTSVPLYCAVHQNQLLFSGSCISWLLLMFLIWSAFTASPLDLSSVITSLNFFLCCQICLLSCHSHVCLILSYKVCLSSCYFILKLADLLPNP